MKKTLLIIILLSIPIISNSATVLQIEDIERLALESNRIYLRALEEVKKAESEITTARSSVLPDLSFDAFYNRNIKLPTFFFDVDGEAVEFTSGFKNDFGASLSLKQSIWKGGKVFKAYRISKQYKKYADAGAEIVKAEVINNAEVLFYSAILAESNLEVLKKEAEATKYNLEIIEKKFSKGFVSEYEVLRARVENANLKPSILEAESEVRLSKKRLKSFIGLKLDEEIVINIKDDDFSLANMKSTPQLHAAAQKSRPEMRQADLLVLITKNAIGVAKAEYYPELEAVSNYSWTTQSDKLTLSDNQVNTWSAGVQLHLPIFNGGSTKGRVNNYKADYNQAELAKNEMEDKIELEVEEAYDKIMQAKKTLDIQSETIAQAEEGLRIANLRYESGIGTQLEVLSAQAALTEARNALARSQFKFRQAKSNLKKISTVDIN